MQRLLLSAGLLLPLALDTFALSAALGVAGLSGRDRIRVTVVFTAFETVMPIAGILVGLAAGRLLGDWAEYGGIALLFIAGLLLLWPGKSEEGEAKRLNLLTHARGWAVLGLGVSISVDELTIGLSAASACRSWPLLSGSRSRPSRRRRLVCVWARAWARPPGSAPNGRRARC